MTSAVIRITTIVFAFSALVVSQTHLYSKDAIIVRNLHNEAVPLFVYTGSFDVYRMIYGTDSPDFIVYEDGTLIFTACPESDNPYSCYYRTAKVSHNELREIRDSLNPNAFFAFQDSYGPDRSKVVVNHVGDRALVMRMPDGSYKRVEVTGWLSGNRNGYSAENVPEELRRMIAFASGYDNVDSKAAKFEFIEVIIEPYADDSNKPLKWPKGLPDLKDPRSVRHKSGDTYSIFVPASLARKAQTLVYKHKLSDNGILINGQVWKAEFRIPFPSEAVWLGDFRSQE